MDIGVAFFPTHDAIDPGALAGLVEERGLESLFFPEHTHIPASRQSQYPAGGTLPRKYFHTYDLFVAMTAAAVATTRLRVGSGICLLIERDPITTAKEVASVDYLSGGRFEFGIGAGSRPDIPWARREYEANGLPYHDFRHSVEDLAEACTVIRRLWTETEPFDFDGAHIHLTGAIGNPKPVQHPYPPILVAGRSAAVLRVAAEHADVWNIAGVDIADAAERSALLDRYCAEIGRDPASVTRSIYLPVSYDQPSSTRDAIGEAIGAGFRHIVLGLPAPYPANVAQWVAGELITTSA